MSTRAAATVRYAILGPVELRDGERPLALGGPRQAALLAMLLVNANRAVSSDRLIDALWGDLGPAGAVKRLQVAIARLRRALDGGDGESVLRTVAGGYQLTVRPGELDAEVFERRFEEGRRALEDGEARRARDVLREALATWRGPALADVAYRDFARAETRRLEELRLAALEARVDAEVALGEHGGLVAELEALVADHPGRERLAAQLMLALYRCGRQAEALEVFARTRSYLSSELGLEPGRALHALQREILEQAPTLDLRTPAADEPVARRCPLPAALATGARDSFVGRDRDLEQLAGAYALAAAGSRQLVLLGGEPGIGKTRLATECAVRAHDDGAIVLYGRCDQEGLLAQQPFVEALRHYVANCLPHELAGRSRRVSGELRRVMPELADLIPDLPGPLEGDPEGARSRLFEAISSMLCEAAQATPLVLVLDDLHWADQATLLLLKYLVRYPGPARLLVLGTYRETELDIDHPLSATLADLARERVLQRRALAPLDAAAVSELVAVHAGAEASPELRRLVYDETEGNPFFVVEVLRHLAESGALGSDGAQLPPLAVPEGIKDVIGQRLARLGPQTSRLLATASVLGRTFELDVLGRLSELGEDELLDALESAGRARVIEEVAGGAGRHTFSHTLIRDALYGSLGATRRAILHRRAGVAFEQAHEADLEPYLAELAHHFEQAGLRGDLQKAIEYGARAGERATSLLAYEQAAAHFRRTVELIGAADPDRLRRQRCDLVIAQGEAERQAGDPAYRRTLLDAAGLAQELGDPERLARAALANSRRFFSSVVGMDRERVAVLQAALGAYDRADSCTRAELLALLALELVTDEDRRLRDGLSDDALAMARRVGDPRTLVLVLTQRCVARWAPQTVPEIRANLGEAIGLADRLADPLLAGDAAYLGAHAAMEAGDLGEADRMLARLAAVAGQLGQPMLRCYDVLARTKRCSIGGPAPEAERLAFEALQLGQRAGQPDIMLWFLGQLFVARFLQGSLDEGDPHLPAVFETPGASLPTSPDVTPSRSLPLLLGAAMSAVLCEVGRLDDARPHFDLLMTRLGGSPHDYTALAIPAIASVACARLGDARSAKRLHAILEPHSHRLVNTGAFWFGATTHHLGLLATTLGELDEAGARFAAAEETYASLDAGPWLARLREDQRATSKNRR